MKKTLLVLIGTSIMALATQHNVSYPNDYRQWEHVKSMVINDAHSLSDPFEGIHHIYANKQAKKGLDTNNYKDGAKFAFDLLEAKRSKEATMEGKRKFVGVMEFDSKKYKKTAGWGFEAYAGDSKTKTIVKDGGASCFSCHVGVKKDSYVFTKYRK